MAYTLRTFIVNIRKVQKLKLVPIDSLLVIFISMTSRNSEYKCYIRIGKVNLRHKKMLNKETKTATKVKINTYADSIIYNSLINFNQFWFSTLNRYQIQC